MDSENRPPSASLAARSASLPPPHRSRVFTTRGRVGRILIACILFLLGLLCGIIGVFVLLFAISSDNPAVANPVVPATSDIVVQIGKAYITHIVSNALQSSGLPGNIQHVQVTLANGDSGDLHR